MKSARPVVLDGCVLVPMPLADTLLRLAAGPRLFLLPKWSDSVPNPTPAEIIFGDSSIVAPQESPKNQEPKR